MPTSSWEDLASGSEALGPAAWFLLVDRVPPRHRVDHAPQSCIQTLTPESWKHPMALGQMHHTQPHRIHLARRYQLHRLTHTRPTRTRQ